LLIHYFILSWDKIIFHFELLVWLIVLWNSECLYYFSSFNVTYIVNVSLWLDEVVVIYNGLYLFRCGDWFYELNILRFLIFDIWLLLGNLNKLIIKYFKISISIVNRRHRIFRLAWNYIKIFEWPTLVI
jgi:hypothetical protein